MSSLFDKQKSDCFSKYDLSRKGSIDGPIVRIIEYINNHVDYFSLSSCSGRVVVFAEGGVVPSNKEDIEERVSDPEPPRPVDPLKIVKSGCDWIHVGHNKVDCAEVIAKVKARAGSVGAIVIKFEPFILHVQCRDLEAAKRLHTAAVEAGYRNSGLTQGRAGKLVAAVRSTHGLEVPISTQEGRLLVSEEYIEYILSTANAKLQENFRRIGVFEEKLHLYIGADKEKGNKKKERKRIKIEKENTNPAEVDHDHDRKKEEHDHWDDLLAHGLDMLM